MKRVLLALLATATLAAFVGSAAASNDVIVLPFTKQGSVIDSHYVGTAAGGVALDMQLSDKYWTGEIQHFTATETLVWPGGRSLTAVLEGRFNNTTGATVLNGRVTSGWLQGAQVHEEGQLVGFSFPIASFAGSLQLMPGSAD
ncbi:MAG TPA: hypothetical protein VFK76_05775 [Gaiellaceae bacterium]|nr:hypothetical protein [Gaiellaceae bacterium]